MALLIITTILWAFSFSLFGEYLAGHVDSYFAVLIRVGLAALVFLPFLRSRGHNLKTISLYMLVGAMQLGIMYMLSFHAYLYLTVSELLLFTVLTPLYITLIYDVMSQRRLRWGYAFSALLAVIGAGIIRYDRVTDPFWVGLLLGQLSNISFAIGIVGYKRLMETRPMPQHNAFAWFYLGAFLVAAVAGSLLGNAQKLPETTRQWSILVFLGVVASGIGYFMWNYGATQVDAGTLGIMNNMHVPAGLLVNLAIWHQQPHWPSFITGAAVILASLWVHRKWVAPRSAQTADDRRRDPASSE
ncbi:carboxylate/amino acid/amine transporter [Salmonella enterica]|uniref:carboxylate/amino acid/amine transporter n=1 Tax=Salmonella enterica TaxID=28901 RepID=UPI000BEFA78B|nr:carboxylate/amino acid/amine transporter [Salmonella enterica]PEH27649.1 EamA family transporter [Salmonella enterica]